MVKKNICVVTGSRADYGYLKIIVQKIEKSNKLNLSLIVTGMHLLKEHGNTIDLIKNDKITITKIIPMYEENTFSSKSLGSVVGQSIINFTDTFNELNPDLIMVLGDRYEPLVATLAATVLKIPVAHIHGGDISGTIDETIRHVITKLAHIHFPATPRSAERIRLMGEEEWRIHMVGSTTIDMIIETDFMNKEKICKKYKLIPNEKIVLCLQHPNVFESEKAGNQMRVTLQVLKDLDLQTIIIYPNNDLGSDLIIKEIKNNINYPKFRIFKNLEREEYLSLLKNIDLQIGNSSGALIESPIFKLPVVNIGYRNKGRETAENVINVETFDFNDIKNAVNKALTEDFKDFCQSVINPYGDGSASDKIIKIIENLQINDELLIKKLTYDV
ncbi:MAG: UDP-N-acetylglucosamine 2-epimerase [Promethearchaeota archaeon]